MVSRSSTVWTACALMVLGLTSTAQAAATRDKAAQASDAAQGVQMVPTGKGYGVPAAAGQHVFTSKIGGDAAGINYHGGPIMATKKLGGAVNVYIIWYGDWATQSPTAKTILHDMFGAIVSGNPYFNINTTYYVPNPKKPSKNLYVKNNIHLMGETDDTAKSLGSALTDANIRTLVSNAIAANKLPSDTNGLYFVLTTKDVNETSGFCTSYCGWHTHASISGADIKYSFVGDAARCINACAAQSKSPNDNPGVDGMASVIMHELEEATTDPDLNAWWDSATGMENADKCAWTFGTTQTAANGSMYNVTWGSRQFLIQRNWVLATNGYCSMQYP